MLTIFIYSPAFSAIFELILSHNARIAPLNKLKNGKHPVQAVFYKKSRNAFGRYGKDIVQD